MAKELIGKKILVTGVVQGVGFRPFIFGLARSLGLNGTVQNSGYGVLILVEGPRESVDKFSNEICARPPVLASISKCLVNEMPLQGFREFRIERTGGRVTGDSVVPPDAATCRQCRSEIFDPADRHYQYPFTNCTNCGPRFTILKKLPYDRPWTSMAEFAMCGHCTGEYEDPGDRRFHAQPVACPECGPKVWLVDRAGRRIEGDWIANARRLLSGGQIIAIKSLGGFHLACNGMDPLPIRILRLRKGRPAKPLAVMCRDLDIVREYCIVSPEEESLLNSPSAPIVVLAKKNPFRLPDELAPSLNSLGVMLPYTPLHLLLFKQDLNVLVMTSGNLTGLPLVADNERAMNELKGIADFFLLHNRDIVHRCDDSVVRFTCGDVQFFRRARGYVPQPIELSSEALNADVIDYIGTGGDMKNTFCLLRKGKAYVSQHFGSIDTVEGLDHYKQSLHKFCELIGARPALAGYDLHPGFYSSAIARSLFPGATGIQHHHAHMASCMAENGLDGDVIGIILDGTGYGTDGHIWGFEMITGGYVDFSREFHLEYLPLPGGDKAVRSPWLAASAYLISLLGQEGFEMAATLFPGKSDQLEIIQKMVDRKINSPLASSCGRLFDAASAILNICLENSYEGQAAIEIGELAPKAFNQLEPYAYEITDDVIGITPLVRAMVNDYLEKVSKTVIVKKFHDTLVKMILDCALKVRTKNSNNRVVLSGGCWHNNYLLTAATRVLKDEEFNVFIHSKVPPGDGGISLGQAMVIFHRQMLNF
ncbi:hydrogenase maturation protein HypF [Desulfotomaculum arcticum]|uniref:Carbamoyltransferase n=1 Tax=Desulfotruncus arcticus DSM 17038 TaxID=1121424 RepID=A0A1I2TW63_9FIRM|nr:carbamoyltransferase HypF [Desulfotruncus arcticus]SFG69118.1 hydrogenase maturation protein HypF [Desulfotomaculum arcticum] [Desulfotruncus arcticus DSM 17038]